MVRVASVFGVVALLALPAATAAQLSIVGTWTLQGNNGVITLTLQPAGNDGVVRGALNGGGMNYRIESESASDRIIGYAIAPDGESGVYFEAMPEGNGLRVLFADLDGAGAPVASSAQQFLFQRGAGVAQGSGGGSPRGLLGSGGSSGQAAAPARPQGPPPGAGGVAGNGPQDQQIAQLFLSSAWCSYSFSGTSTGSGGTEQTQRAVFQQDGTLMISGASESSYSGSVNDQYGNQIARGGTAGGQRNAQAFRWRVENAMLMLSQDGGQWTPVQLQITRNSNGYPIVNAGGTEYAQCN